MDGITSNLIRCDGNHTESIYTPETLTAGTQKSPNWSPGKIIWTKPPWLWGSKMLFFRVVDSKWTFQWTLANLVTQDCCQNNRVLFVNHEGVMTRRCTFESIWWCKVELLDTWKILSRIKWDKMVKLPCGNCTRLILPAIRRCAVLAIFSARYWAGQILCSKVAGPGFYCKVW